MKNIDKLFIDHVNKLRTKDNAVMIEAILEGFGHFVKSIKALTESHEDFMSDEDLKKMSDEEAKQYVEKISNELLKMKLSDNEIRNYLSVVHNRLFKARLALQGRKSMNDPAPATVQA